MPNFIFSNFANDTLAAAITSTTQTSVTLSSTANAPTITAGQTWVLVLNDAATQSVFEIIYVTARTGAVCTVLRGQEGTAAATWLVNDFVYATDTAGILGSYAPLANPGSFAIDTSNVAQTKVGGFASSSYLFAGASGSTTTGDITAGRTTTSGVYAFGSSAAHALDFNVTNANKFTFSDALVAPSLALGAPLPIASGGTGSATQNFLDFTSNQTGISGAKTFTNQVVINGTGSKLILNGTATNGFTLTPATDTTAASFIITNAAGSANLFNFSHINSAGGSLEVAGFIGVFPGGTFSTPASVASGDGVFQRSNSTGVAWFGGSAQSGSEDYNLNNPLGFSFRNASGYVQLFGAAYNNVSDTSLKSDVTPITDALETVLKLKPSNFTWKYDNRADIGFIAQDLNAVIPMLTSTDADGLMGMAYHGISTLAIAGLQDMAAKLKLAGISGF